MKSYNEMAQSVLERRDRYLFKRAYRLRAVCIAVPLCCVCAAAVFAGALRGHTPPIVAGYDTSETTDHSSYSQVSDFIESAPAEDSSPKNSAEDNAEEGWMPASKFETGGAVVGGLCVLTFTAYDGALYGAADYCVSESDFVMEEGELLYNINYRYNVYRIKDKPDHIAIFINGGFTVYEKIRDFVFDMGGDCYGIAFCPVMDADYARGELVKDEGDFSVYEAVRLQGEQTEKEYIVDISEYLKTERPNIFDNGENWAEFTWIARKR